MYTQQQLRNGLLDLATRAADVVIRDRSAAHERELSQGLRTEFTRSINDVPLAALRVLEDLRQAADDAQSALIHQLEAGDAGPTYTEIGAALGTSKQSGRKRAAKAVQWGQEHRPPKANTTIEEVVEMCVAPTAAQRSRTSWPDDGSIPQTGRYGEPVSQDAVAKRALGMGIGISGSR